MGAGAEHRRGSLAEAFGWGCPKPGAHFVHVSYQESFVGQN